RKNGRAARLFLSARDQPRVDRKGPRSRPEGRSFGHPSCPLRGQLRAPVGAARDGAPHPLPRPLRRVLSGAHRLRRLRSASPKPEASSAGGVAPPPPLLLFTRLRRSRRGRVFFSGRAWRNWQTHWI